MAICHLLCMLCILCSTTFALHITPNDIDKYLLDSYDYIIVGGGTAGLTVARRLSEDPQVTVLVLEAGALDNSRDLSIPKGLLPVPGIIGSGGWLPYQWNLTTTPQAHLGNRSLEFSQGRVVGGSSVLNGLCWTRGPASDYDAWERLGNKGWGWKDLLPYFRKSENFTLLPKNTGTGGLPIHPISRIHGKDGPVHVTYPHYFYNQSVNVLRGFEELGIPIIGEPNNGQGAGAMVLPSSMHPENQTRFDARQAHFEPTQHRPNLHIATQQRATRIVLAAVDAFTTSRRVVGVEFAENEAADKITVTCVREVVLSAGAIFSPTLLQVSGIGSRKVLQSINVSTEISLPGVGHNLQDHPMVHAKYRYSNASVFTSTDIRGNVLDNVTEAYIHNHTGPWTAPLVNTVGFPALRSLTDAFSFLANKTSSGASSLPSKLPWSVKRGYEAQLALLREQILGNDTGIFEVMATSAGELTVAAQKTFSRGTVRPASASMFDLPLLDPRYCSNRIDCEILVLGLQLNMKLIKTAAMKELMPKPEERFNTTDRLALMREVLSNIDTERHPCCTTAMMPLDKGGVVDRELRVYGTCNLRIVDAGIMPIIPAAHLQAAVYAVAEKAADMIRAAPRRLNCPIGFPPPRPEPPSKMPVPSP